MDLKPLTEALAAGREISPPEAAIIASALADPAVPAAEKEAFLETLSKRGETPVEIAGFARAFRAMARDPGLSAWSPAAIDVCGTGGDRSGSFNISTVVALILAAAGVPVIKHGNRSITSQCGSADLVEALGIRIEMDAELAKRSMDRLSFVFLFAPAYHPAFKEIGPVRRALAARGVRTIFNLLGPLLNPAAPAHQIVGVFGQEYVAPVARALDSLGLAGGMAVHSVDASGRRYDELTTVGANTVAGFGRQRDLNRQIVVQELGMVLGAPADLAGGDVAANLASLDRLISGTAPETLTDSIVFNASAALHAVGRTPNFAAGFDQARDLLHGGAVELWLAKARSFYR